MWVTVNPASQFLLVWCTPRKMLVLQSCLALCSPMNCNPPGSAVHGILQARILEWVAIPFSRESSQPRDQTRSSVLQADSLPSEPRDLPKPWFWVWIDQSSPSPRIPKHYTPQTLIKTHAQIDPAPLYLYTLPWPSYVVPSGMSVLLLGPVDNKLLYFTFFCHRLLSGASPSGTLYST